MKKLKAYLLCAVSSAALFFVSCSNPAITQSANSNASLTDILKDLSIPDETIVSGGWGISSKICFLY